MRWRWRRRGGWGPMPKPWVGLGFLMLWGGEGREGGEVGAGCRDPCEPDALWNVRSHLFQRKWVVLGWCLIIFPCTLVLG